MVKDLSKTLGDKEWRLNNLYKIKNKHSQIVPFVMNVVQAKYYKERTNRNITVKARQLGISTFELIDALDDTMFNENFTSVIIADRKENVMKLFNIIKTAIENLPKNLNIENDINKYSADEISFKSINSNIYVALSTRSGTVNRLHVSELGKMSRSFPERAEEVITGAFESVPLEGRISIESTAEGFGGHFFDLWTDSPQNGFKGFFHAWFDEPEYQTSIKHVLPRDFLDRQKEYNLTDEQINWYYFKSTTLKRKLAQEYPCVIGDTMVSTKDGIIKIKDIKPDGDIIKNWFYKGEKQTYKLLTSLGYEVTATSDHKILTPEGYIELGDMEGKEVILEKPIFNKGVQKVKVEHIPFVKSSIEINEEFSRFLGYFMGDGSYTSNNAVVSIACDVTAIEVARDIRFLFNKFLGGFTERLTGKNKGCLEIRKGNVKVSGYFKQLGILRQNSSGCYKRKVNIPEYIFRSPKNVIKQFLIGLFEADGFIDRSGARIVLFSAYELFLKDVQYLLLGFGITSKLTIQDKTSGDGHVYTGRALTLRMNECNEFKKSLGFISNKKKMRLFKAHSVSGYGSKEIIFRDNVVKISKERIEKTYDIETDIHSFIANGIVVHNCCASEAFLQSGRPVFDSSEVKRCNEEEPRGGHSYGAGIDTATGAGKDFSVLTIIDKETGVQVLTYRSQEPIIVFANKAIGYCLKYNEAKLNIELNGVGESMMNECASHHSYDNLYQEKTGYDQRTQKWGKRTGTYTTRNVKENMIESMKEGLRDGKMMVSHEKTYFEILAYQYDDSNKMNAPTGGNDDGVMAYALAVRALEDVVASSQKTGNSRMKKFKKHNYSNIIGV